eukprot:4313182-Alexandrium_andersonii.AAC.1
MSASLVGSEMCIRDSNVVSEGSRSRASANTDPDHEHSELPEPDVTVSYTHLTLPTICSV